MYKFKVYYYDKNKDQFQGIDHNLLYVNDKFVAYITEVRSGNTLSELEPNDGEELILLVPSEGINLDIINHNPCPEEF